MDKKNKLTKLSKSLLLGASATFLYGINGDGKIANAMLRPISKIPKTYQNILSGVNTGSPNTSYTLKNTLGSYKITVQSSSTVKNATSPLSQTQNNNPTNTSNILQNKSTPSPNKSIITSKLINSPGSGSFVSSRSKFFENSSTNESTSNSNQTIPSTSHVATLKLTFEKNTKTSGTKANSISNQSATSKNQISNSKLDKVNKPSLVGKFYESTPQNSETQNTIPTAPKVSELKKNFETSGNKSTTNSKLIPSPKPFGGKINQNKQEGKATTNKTNIINRGSTSTKPKSSNSEDTGNIGNISQLIAKFNGTIPKTPETLKEPTPPKVSELRNNFESSETKSTTSSKQSSINIASLARPFGGTVQENKQKQQAIQNKASVSNLVGNFESVKPKTSQSSKNKSPQGEGNVTSLVARFSGTAPKAPETPEEPTPIPPKVSELRNNFETPKSQPTPIPEPTPINVRSLIKTFDGSDKQEPESPSGKMVKTLAKNFGVVKGGNKNNHPRQLTYEEMIQ